MRFDIRGTAVVAVMLGAMLPLAACAGAGPELPLTHTQANAEYAAEAARWELPPGWEWPDGPVYTGVGPDGAPAVYGPGIGRVDATYHWFCAWSRTLIEASSEVDRAHALAQVLRARETPLFEIGLLGEDRDHYEAILVAAEAGDLDELAHSTDLNCPGAPPRP